MSTRENQMFTGEIMFLDILVFIVASTYWYMTGNYIPAITGYAFLLIFLYSDELYFVSLVMGLVTIIAIIISIFYDYNLYKDEEVVIQTGISVLYMYVVYLKSRSIFNAD